MKLLKFALVTAIGIFASVAHRQGSAADWNGSVNNQWGTAANWTGTTPTQFNVQPIVFSAAGAGNLSTDVFTGGQFFISDLSTNANATSFSVNNTAGGLNELAISGDVYINSGAANLAAAINYPIFFNKVANTTLTFDVDGVGRSLDVREIHRHSVASLRPGQSVIKSGSGIMTLSTGGTSTYHGTTTVNGGILAMNGTNNNGSGVIVNSMGTLRGTGSLNQTVTVNTGGTIAPGGSIGTFNTGGVSLTDASAVMAIEINPSLAPTADLLNVTGTVSPGGGTLNLSLLTTPSASPLTFLIVNNDLGDAITTTFGSITGLPMASSATVNYAFAGVDALGRVGDGNDIAVTIHTVPEPSSIALSVMSLASLAAFARKRRTRSLKSQI